MLLCTREAIIDLLHEGYVQACENQNKGIVDRTISAVSGEIRDMLSYRYPPPWSMFQSLFLTLHQSYVRILLLRQFRL